jgi:hypothetical protein
MFRRNNFFNCCQQNPCSNQIIEPTITKCVEQVECHNVEHICPIHTHYIKKDIYNHTYVPRYTVSEENQVINNDPGSCCNLANNS